MKRRNSPEYKKLLNRIESTGLQINQECKKDDNKFRKNRTI